MENLYKMLIENPTTETDKAWNRWVYTLIAHGSALVALQDTAKAVDNAFNEYIKLRG